MSADTISVGRGQNERIDLDECKVDDRACRDRGRGIGRGVILRREERRPRKCHWP